MKKFILSILFVFILGIFIGMLAAPKCQFNNKTDTSERLQYFEYRYIGSLFAKAEEEFKNKNYEEVQKLLDIENYIANTYYPRNPDSRITCNSEIIKLNKAIEKNPKNYNLYYRRANIFNTSNNIKDKEHSFCSDYKSAIEDYTKVIELNPKHKEVYEKRLHAIGMSMNGITYEKSEEKFYDKLFAENRNIMLSDIQKSIELNGENNDRLQTLGGLYCSTNQPQKGIKIFKKLSKTDYIAYYGLGICYLKANEPEKSLMNFNTFINSPYKCNEKCDEDSIKLFYYQQSQAHWKLHNYFAYFKDIVNIYKPVKQKDIAKFCHCDSK